MAYLTQPHAKLPEGSGCCHLLTALNAARFYGRPTTEPGTTDFERFIDLVRCRYGAALRLEETWRLLGLEVQLGPHALGWVGRALGDGCPVGLSVFAPDFGFHSVLAIDYDGDGDLSLVNWEAARPISKVAWEHLQVPPFAYGSAERYALRTP